MQNEIKTRPQWSARRKFFALAALALVLVLVVLVSIRLITGQGFGLRSLPRNLLSTARAVIHSQEVKGYSQGEYTNIIFLHHSTGENLVNQGGIREQLSEAGYDFWNQGYNSIGLRGPDGETTGFAYPVPRDNTDPDGLARVFNQRAYSWPINTLSGLLQYEVIMIKSCFAPTSKITSDQQLAQYQEYYLQIRDTIDRYPDKVFIILTQPPLNPAETNPEEAKRARALASWLKADEYLDNHPNLFVFDLFDVLALDESTSPEFSMLRPEYRNGSDSHPSQTANEEIGPLLVDFVIDVIQRFHSESVDSSG